MNQTANRGKHMVVCKHHSSFQIKTTHRHPTAHATVGFDNPGVATLEMSSQLRTDNNTWMLQH